MDIPCLGSGGTPPHAYVNIVNGRLMTWCQFFSHDMWDARNCAPILWIPAPGGDYFVDTRVSLAGLGDPQVAGIVVYDGPDGANGAVTLGLDTYENSGTVTVAALQRVGDHNFDRFSPALSLPNGWLDLRLLRQGNTFTAWYSEVGGDVWKILGSLDYAGSAARVGLFLKNGGPGHDEAYFNWFTLWRNTAPPSPSSGWPSLFSPQFDGRKDSLSFDWVPNAGPLTLYGVSASGGRLAAVERGEGILYVAGKLGVKYGLRSIIVGTDSFQATASIEIPPILGGYQADIDVRYTKERGWEGDGFYLSIPGVVEKDAFSMEKVFLEVRPSKGSYGGGGLFGIGRVGKRYGGWVTVDATLGSNGDVTLFGLGEGNLNQPIGDTGAFLQEVDGKIVNSSGLSSATNWGGSTLLGHIEFSAGPRLDIPVGGPWFVLSAKGDLRWNIHDSSFTVDGTGTLLKHFDLASVHGTYTPTANVDVTARFSDPTGIYSGSANLHASGSSFTGSLSGDLRIPGAVPVVGGLGIGNVSASLDGTSLKGHGSVDVAHGTRQVCHDVCNSACSWIPFLGNICRSVCNSVCDWVPNFFGVPFDFELDPSSGSFTFHPHPPFRKVPILVASAGDGTATLDVPAGAPAAFFRAAYTAPGVTRVDLTLSTPSGEVLRSADGPLPAGFRTVSGFSRFNPDAREQVIALADPAPGRYSVSVADVERLGGVTVELILPRHFRSLDVTSLAPVDGKGKYSVSWRAEDPDGIRRVRVFLARDRLVPSGPLAADVAVDGALSHASSVTIDTSLATVGAGWYWLVLEAEDSTGATLKKVSDEPVLVSPASAPLPPRASPRARGTAPSTSPGRPARPGGCAARASSGAART